MLLVEAILAIVGHASLIGINRGDPTRGTDPTFWRFPIASFDGDSTWAVGFCSG